MLRILTFVIAGSLLIHPVYSQGKFILQDGKEREKIKFELVNNLIILPVKVNGVELSFLLDTGVNSTVLLNLDEVDSVELREARKIFIRGLGGDELIEAIKSENNVVEVGSAIHKDLELYVIDDEELNFSPRLGQAVHGILGYDFFRDFIVEINYARKFLKVHSPQSFRHKLRNYNREPLRFYRNKPYVQARIRVEEHEEESTLLVDSGLGDGLWLFQDEEKLFQIPQRSFQDFLGLGLLGDVHGARSRIASLSLGGYELKDLTCAFPDSAAVKNLMLFKQRNGSLGAEVLKRFNVIFDYGGAQMYLKKNRNFNRPFVYNMSGIILEQRGFVIAEIREKLQDDLLSSQGVIVSFALSKKYELKPDFRVVKIRENSPAAKAGLLVGDRILSLNNKKAYNYTMEEIATLFSSGEGKKITLKVQREGVELVLKFELEDLL